MEKIAKVNGAAIINGINGAKKKPLEKIDNESVVQLPEKQYENEPVNK